MVSTSTKEVETDFVDIWDRLKIATRAKDDLDIGKALGRSQSSISSAKTKKKIPSSWLVDASRKLGISVNWLLFGEGPMRRGEAAEPVAPGTFQPQTELEALRRENQGLREENGELRRTCQEYAKQNLELLTQNRELLKIEAEYLRIRPDRDSAPAEEASRKSA